jgi:hypothetical protein
VLLGAVGIVVTDPLKLNDELLWLKSIATGRPRRMQIHKFCGSGQQLHEHTRQDPGDSIISSRKRPAAPLLHNLHFSDTVKDVRPLSFPSVNGPLPERKVHGYPRAPRELTSHSHSSKQRTSVVVPSDSSSSSEEMIRIMHRSAGSATIAWLLNGAVSLSDLAGVLKIYSPNRQVKQFLFVFSPPHTMGVDPLSVFLCTADGYVAQ